MHLEQLKLRLNQDVNVNNNTYYLPTSLHLSVTKKPNANWPICLLIWEVARFFFTEQRKEAGKYWRITWHTPIIFILSVMSRQIFYTAFWPLAKVVAITHKAPSITRIGGAESAARTPVSPVEIMWHSQIVTNFMSYTFCFERRTSTIKIDRLLPFIKTSTDNSWERLT